MLEKCDLKTNCTSLKVVKIMHTGSAKKSAYSLRTQLGMPSGPDALQGFKAESAEETSGTLRTTTSETGSKGGRLSIGDIPALVLEGLY